MYPIVTEEVTEGGESGIWSIALVTTPMLPALQDREDGMYMHHL